MANMIKIRVDNEDNNILHFYARFNVGYASIIRYLNENNYEYIWNTKFDENHTIPDSMINDYFNEFIVTKKSNDINLLKFLAGLEKVPNNELYVEVTDDCNLNCWYCFNLLDGKRTREYLDFSYFERLLDLIAADPEYRKYPVNVLCIGGEPLMVEPEKYEHIIKYAQCLGLNFNLSMQSNITLLNDKWMNLLNKYKNFSIGKSFDGFYSNRTKSDPNLYNNFLKLQEKSKGFISVGTVEYFNNLEKEYEYNKKQNVHSVKLNLLKGPINTELHDLVIEKIIKLFDLINEDYFNDVDNIPSYSLLDDMIDIICNRPNYIKTCDIFYNGIDRYGNLNFCKYNPNFSKISKINIMSPSIKKFSDIAENIYKKLYIEDCLERTTKCKNSDCPLAGLCNYGCNWEVNQYFNGKVDKNANSHCKVKVDLYLALLSHLKILYDEDKIHDKWLKKFNLYGIRKLKGKI